MQLWAGDGDSLKLYLDLKDQYEQGNLSATSDLRARIPTYNDDDEKLNPFGVSDSRIGLMHLERMGNTAVMHIQGSLVNGHQWWHYFTVGDITSYDSLKDAADIIRSSDDVSRVILMVNSGGGHVAGLDSTTSFLKQAFATKTVVVHSDVYMGSAAYWLGSSFGKIYASPMAQIGNIGTMALLPDYSEALEKSGVKFHLFKAGREKGYGIPQTAFSEDELAHFQKYVEKSNNFFLSHVSRHRNVMLSDVDKWGEAQTFFAGEAKAVKLIDEVATLQEVIGSLTASTTNGDSGMVISQEKQAAITAGAAPESVLTTAELAHYQAQLAANPDEGENPDADPKNPEENQGNPETAPEPTASSEPVPTASDMQLAKELGRAEAKIEALTEQLEVLTAKVESSKAQMESLTVVAQAAVANLQTALQLPKEAKASAADILAQYNSLTEQMKARFPVGRQSSAHSETAPLDVKPKIPHPVRFQHKEA